METLVCIVKKVNYILLQAHLLVQISFVHRLSLLNL